MTDVRLPEITEMLEVLHPVDGDQNERNDIDRHNRKLVLEEVGELTGAVDDIGVRELESRRHVDHGGGEDDVGQDLQSGDRYPIVQVLMEDLALWAGHEGTIIAGRQAGGALR